MSPTDEEGLSGSTRSWLAERKRPGNWYAIAPDDEIPHDVLGWFRTLLNLFQIAVTPEIERRLRSGQIDHDFELLGAQLIQYEDRPNTVRLNREVRIMATIKIDCPMETGASIPFSKASDILSIDLHESELDCGHFTMIWNGTGWLTSFDFRIGRAKCLRFIGLARDFLSSARLSAQGGYTRPSVDALFSACELLSKAQLVLLRSFASKTRKHSAIGSAINLGGRAGNINAEFLRLYNRMANARTPARYDPDATVLPPTDRDFDVVHRELVELERRVAHRVT